MPVNRRYFENLMANRRMSLRSLADKMGMTHSQLSLTFSGSRRMQLEEAAALADIFNVPLQQVAEHAGVAGAATAGRRVPVVAVLRGDGTVQPSTPVGAERTTSPDGLPATVEAIQARTADSPLAWLDGWVFFFDPTDALGSDALGRFCYAKLKGGDGVLATLRRGYHSNDYALSGPHASESAELEWASPILLTRQ